MKKNNIVYRHIRLDTNEVFYIGICFIKKRPYNKTNRSKFWKNIVNKTDYRVDILFDDLTKDVAIEKEIEFIKLYGRRDLGLGTLVNMTDGGDGITTPSPSTRKKMSERRLGAKHSTATKLKISKANTGHTKTKGFYKKICKPVLQLDLNDNIIKQWDSISEAGRNGFTRSAIGAICNGIGITHYGYKWKFA